MAKLVIECPQGRIFVDATKNRKRSYYLAVECAVQLNGIVRLPTEEEKLEDGWN